MPLLPFLALACNRLRNRWLFTLMLFCGITLSIGMMVCIPVFSEAVGQALVLDEVNATADILSRPAFSVRFYTLPSPSHPMTLADAAYTRDWLADMMARHIGLPVRGVYSQNASPQFRVQFADNDGESQNKPLFYAAVICIDGIGDHIRVIEGAPYGRAPFGQADTADTLAVWITPQLADRVGLQVGEVYQLAAPPQGTVTFQIAGLWEATDPADEYWYLEPQGLLGQHLLTTSEMYDSHVARLVPQGTGYSIWYYVLDDSVMRLDRTEQYIQGLDRIEREVRERLPNGKMDYAPRKELTAGLQRKQALSVILLAFSLPVLGILALFIGSVSSMAVQSQSQETAILTSRGSGRLQIGLLILLETIIVFALACPAGIYTGLLLARLMGYSRHFLTFVPRPPLRVHLYAVDWRYAAAAIALGLVARLVPAWRSLNLSIVTYERKAIRREIFQHASRLLAMALLGAVCAYSYRQLALRGSLALTIGPAGEGTINDPLLLLAPSLFLFVVPFFATEFFALAMRPLALLGKHIPSITAYLGLLNLGREGGQYRTPVYLLTLCLSLGIFYASLAKSADSWLTERLRYRVGADLTFKPALQQVSDTFTMSTSDLEAAVLPITQYQTMDGVQHATRVAEYEGRVGSGSAAAQVRVLGIDRVDFARIAYYRPDFADKPLGNLMNQLASTPNGVLLPRKMAADLALGEGDALTCQMNIGKITHPVQLEIVGTFDYFPTMIEEQRPVLVINLDYFEQVIGGSSPYSVWMRLEPEAQGEDVLEQIRQIRVTPTLTLDLREILTRDQERLERIGIFGLLSLCFLAGALLAGIGLLLYHFASLMTRAVRFGILQATGMRRGEIIGSTTLEYVVTLLYSILAGAASGVAASMLYVPFFPLTEDPGTPIPPFVPVIDWEGAGWMLLTVGLALLVVEAAIILSMDRLRVFEMLRLGNKE
jgi:putative ABC transport system permease protein